MGSILPTPDAFSSLMFVSLAHSFLPVTMQYWWHDEHFRTQLWLHRTPRPVEPRVDMGTVASAWQILTDDNGDTSSGAGDKDARGKRYLRATVNISQKNSV